MNQKSASIFTSKKDISKGLCFRYPTHFKKALFECALTKTTVNPNKKGYSKTIYLRIYEECMQISNVFLFKYLNFSKKF